MIHQIFVNPEYDVLHALKLFDLFCRHKSD